MPALAQKTAPKQPGPEGGIATESPLSHGDGIETQVMGKMLITLYHELAHGLVDIFGLPMLGREEDAADAFALIELITQIRSADTDDATDAILADYGRGSAFAWYQSSQDGEGSVDRSAYFGPHALDQQRMFTTVCLLFGAEPEIFGDLPADLGIGGLHLVRCDQQFQQAYDGWTYTLDTFGAFETDMGVQPADDLTFTFDPPEDAAHRRWADAVKNWPYFQEVQRHFSTSFLIDHPIDIVFRSCGEENAYYYPGEYRVIMCYDLMVAFARYARQPLNIQPTSGFADDLEQAMDEMESQ